MHIYIVLSIRERSIVFKVIFCFKLIFPRFRGHTKAREDQLLIDNSGYFIEQMGNQLLYRRITISGAGMIIAGKPAVVI